MVPPANPPHWSGAGALLTVGDEAFAIELAAGETTRRDEVAGASLDTSGTRSRAASTDLANNARKW